MPLYSIPVAVAYQLDGDPHDLTHAVGVQAIGTTGQAAQVVGLVLTKALIQMRHPGKTGRILQERVKVGQPSAQVEGPYAYVFTRGTHINQLVFPSRIDQDRGSHLDDALNGLDPAQTFGLLVDCIHLNYINSTGLGALAAHALRLNMRLFRISDPIAKVLEITGLTRAVPAYQDLPSALTELVRNAHRPAER